MGESGPTKLASTVPRKVRRGTPPSGFLPAGPPSSKSAGIPAPSAPYLCIEGVRKGPDISAADGRKFRYQGKQAGKRSSSWSITGESRRKQAAVDDTALAGAFSSWLRRAHRWKSKGQRPPAKSGIGCAEAEPRKPPEPGKAIAALASRSVLSGRRNDQGRFAPGFVTSATSRCGALTSGSPTPRNSWRGSEASKDGRHLSQEPMS